MDNLKTMRGTMNEELFVLSNRSRNVSDVCVSRAYKYLVAGYSLLQIGKAETPPRGKDAVRGHVLKWLRENRDRLVGQFHTY